MGVLRHSAQWGALAGQLEINGHKPGWWSLGCPEQVACWEDSWRSGCGKYKRWKLNGRISIIIKADINTTRQANQMKFVFGGRRFHIWLKIRKKGLKHFS